MFHLQKIEDMLTSVSGSSHRAFVDMKLSRSTEKKKKTMLCNS